MFVDPDRPLPLPGDKKDGIGVVLEAIIEIGNARIDATGDAAKFQETVTEAMTDSEAKIQKMFSEVDQALKVHEAKRGVVHGETKTTVGLPLKENWPMATPAQMEAATANNVFCYPSGLGTLVQSRLAINPDNYLRGRLIPLATGGQLGSIAQWPFDWREGEIVQSFQDPMLYYTETPWQFSTAQGIQLYPALNGSDILTQQTADPGREKRAITAWGGTAIRVYNGQLDLRRTRPSLLRGESSSEPNNQLIKGSTHLFDRHSVFYMEPTWVGVRAFNKVRLPFDILNNNGVSKTNWSGIIEARENFIYNIFCHMERGNIGGYGDDIYLVMELDIYNFTENGLVVKDGPGRPAETIAYLGDSLNTFTYSLPTSNKFRRLPRAGKPDAICIKMGDILTYTAAQRDALWATLNKTHTTHIAFAWRNRLNGEFAIRIPLGFYSQDRQFYTNYYLDVSCQVRENLANKSAAIVVNSLRDITASIQTVNNNLQVTKEGRFVQYPASVKDDIFHPLIFSGTFESQGGHIKAYTLYNRQYIGYYQHNVTGVDDWLRDGDVIKPVLTKYNYKEMSTLNNDGMYGDHLRHVPLAIIDGKTEYLTYSRDWNNSYRWAVAKVATDTVPELLSPSGHHMGPWREGVNWIRPSQTTVPSFLVVNSEAASEFDVNCLVFNNLNNFRGYARYQYDVANIEDPIQFLDPVEVDDLIVSFVSVVGGGWLKNLRQMFYYRNRIYFFSQCIGKEGFPADGYDCYYGWIDGAYIDVSQEGVRTVRINGTVSEKATVKKLKVNNIASLDIPTSSIFGYNELNATDTYMMLMERTGSISTHQLMVNLGPYNNFYFEFRLTVDDQLGTTDVVPNPVAVDPVFPYDPARGYNINYDELIAYGTKTPHRFHVNYQTPVMLKKSMWSYRKTPGMYGIFAQSIGTSLAHAGLMNSVPGVQLYPVGSSITVGGSNIVVKAPVSAKETTFNGNDELLLRLSGTGSRVTTGSQVDLYGVNNNPNGYEVEPNSGVVPCGFLKNSIFYHYDPDGWRNDLLPVIDGKRMNFYGYGSSFPAFMGIYGSGLPINRFFLTDRPTTLSWNTATGRLINVGPGTNITITINNVLQTYTGGGTFTIPGTFTGTVTVQITGATTVTWSPGLAVLSQIGNTVNRLDFQNSTAFTINAPLPRRIVTLANLFKGATGANYPSIETWDTSNVIDMSGCFSGAVNFNHNISNWNTSKVETMESMFEGAKAFNQPIGKWNVSSVTTARRMFKGASAFNQSLNTWVTYRVATFFEAFMGASAFTGNISAWNVGSCSDFGSMFEDAIAFNVDLSSWDVSGAIRTDRMFAGAVKFNSNLTAWRTDGITTMEAMFKNALAFARNLAAWNTGRVTNMKEMFSGTLLFGKDGSFNLNSWDLSKVVDASQMFYNSYFNCPVNGWAFGENCYITSMFEGSKAFNQDISSWDVRNVYNASRLMYGTTLFQLSISDWNLQSCVDLSYMFANSSYRGDLINWKLKTTTPVSLTGMFNNAAFFNGAGIASWNTGAVTSFQDIFYGATVFNVDISGWDTSAATTMRQMFRQTDLFNQDISGWDVSNVTDISDMFNQALKFNQPIGSWNTGNVVLMNGTFLYTKSFNQPLEDWDTSNVTTFTSMFGGTGPITQSIFNQPIGKWNTSKATIMTRMFINQTSFNQDLSTWDVSQRPVHVDFATGATAWVLPKPNFLD